jgi:osmotically-inducible protein OsmY
MKRLPSFLFLTVPVLFAQTSNYSREIQIRDTQTTSAPKHSDDDRIYDEVRRKLANDVDVKGAGIDVAVKSGVVTLSGKVHTEHGKEKAEKLTKKTKGVTSVVNNLVATESEK